MIFKNINSRVSGEVLGSKCLFLGKIYKNIRKKIAGPAHLNAISFWRGSRTEVRGVKTKFFNLKIKKNAGQDRRRINSNF